MVRLSFDAEMWRRGITDVPLPPDLRDEIEAGLRRQLLELIAAGTDVVLDFSFWSRRMRDDYRALLAPPGSCPRPSTSPPTARRCWIACVRGTANTPTTS